MKKLFAVLSVTALMLAGCAAAPEQTQTQTQPTTETEGTVSVSIPNGVGEAVVPEEGDIVIEITP